MSASIDWSEWILQKNSEAKQEELKKSDFVKLEELEKSAMYKDESGVYIDPSNHKEHDIDNTSYYSGHINVGGNKVESSGTDRKITDHQRYIIDHVSKKLGIHPDKVAEDYHLIHYAINSEHKKPFIVTRSNDKNGESIAINYD